MKVIKELHYKKYIIVIAILLFVSFVFIGCKKESIENEIYNQKKLSQLEDNKSTSDELQTIIIQLPGLPEDAIKMEMIYEYGIMFFNTPWIR